MPYDNQIAIGPEFFAKAKNDYNDWHWAIAREFQQNCIDAPGTRNISIQLEESNGATTLVVENDGAPMSEDILTNKLLSLGSSGKDFVGSVGGFGKAKEILYFCHRLYTIHTGSLLCTGSGAGYSIDKAEHLSGTRSTVTIEGSHSYELKKAFRKFATYAQWNGTLTLDGDELPCVLRKGSKRRTFDWGTVYTSKAGSYEMAVRINGTPMFTRSTSVDRLIVIELHGTSADILQSSRDGLKGDASTALDSFLQEIAVDKVSALRAKKQTSYTRYVGPRLGRTEGRITVAASLGISNEEIPRVSLVDTGCEADYNDYEDSEIERSVLGYEFVIKNESGMEIPDYYTPGAFGAYATRVARTWTKSMLEIWRLFKEDEVFSVGFLFASKDDTGVTLAQYEQHPTYGTVFYINPVKIVEQANSRSRSMKKRWSFDAQARWKLVALAAHEYCHHKGYNWHDERYSCFYTNKVEPVILANRQSFNACFR